MKNKYVAIVYAFIAALFYAAGMPFSKILLREVDTFMAAGMLYLGAGIGIFALSKLAPKLKLNTSEKLSKEDLKYVVAMILLDILAPILLMTGLFMTTSSNAALLNNFEIVATSIIALVVFKEAISRKLWVGIILVIIASFILSFEDMSSLKFSWGSIFILLATIAWGFENNCTRMISNKSVFEIVTIKGIFSGTGSVLIAFLIGQNLPPARYVLAVLLIGFISYGLGIFFYVKAQATLGAAKTSAYYAIAPFVGVLLSVLILGDSLTLKYFVALAVMIPGSIIIVIDTLTISHEHRHKHRIHVLDGGKSSYKIVEHSHIHRHYMPREKHIHRHMNYDDM